MFNYNVDSLLSCFKEENSNDLNDFFGNIPHPIKNTFSEINKIESISKFINNSKSHDLNGQFDTKK